MIVTKRDKEILKFIEEYGSITINQCKNIFFTNNKYDYYQARMRLKLLADNNLIKRYRHDMRSETIYYFDKKLSIHDLKILDFYSRLVVLGAKIKTFERRYMIPTPNAKMNYREADALFEVVYKGYWHSILLEVDYTHFTWERKVLDIYESNFFQAKYKELDDNIFPKIVIVRQFMPKEKIKSKLFDVEYLNFELDNLYKILE